jgi:hypothetical protein
LSGDVNGDGGSSARLTIVMMRRLDEDDGNIVEALLLSST